MVGEPSDPESLKGKGRIVATAKSLKFLAAMLLLSLGFLANSLTLQSPIIGASVALAYLVVGGYSLKGVFGREKKVGRWGLGVLFLLVLIAAIGWVFTISYKLEVMEVFMILVAVSFLSSTVSRLTRDQESADRPSEVAVITSVRLLEIMYAASAFLLFLLLVQSRTLVPMTVWKTLNPLVLPLFFLSLVLLIVILFSGEKWQISLVLVVVQSILAHAFFVLIFDAGYGVDQWAALGWTCRLFDASDYPQGVVFSLNVPFQGGRFGFVYQLFKSIGTAFQPTLSTVLARIFTVDVYWVHILLVPILWGVFLPVIAYRLTETITRKRNSALLGAVLTLAAPSLILWGAVSVPNSLGFLLFFFDILLIADYISFDRSIIWAFVVASVTVLAHMMPGVVAFALVVTAFAFKNSSRLRWQKARVVLQVSVFVAGMAVLPVALMMGGVSYPALTGARFGLDRLQSSSLFDAIMLLLVGGYGGLVLKEALIYGLLPLLGFLGLTYINLSTAFTGAKRATRFLLFAFALVVVDSRIIEVFLFNVPFGAGRVWVLSDMLSIPFAAILMVKIAEYALKNIAAGIGQSTVSKYQRVASNLSMTALVLGLSALITMSLVLGYTVSNAPSSPQNAYLTSSELEAARFIDSIANERYVVVSYTFFKLAGYAVVGTSNPLAYYSLLYDAGWMDQLFNEVNHGSALGMYDATMVNNASVGFYVTSRARFPDEADQVISSLLDRPDFRLVGVFQDDVYVFSYRPPVPRVVEGIGPSINVLGSIQAANTTYTRDMVSYETTYKVDLVGSSEYFVTNWPASWSFEMIAPQPTTASVDANSWINFTGSAGTTYTVSWASNDLYKDVGWKDDSYMADWNVRHAQGFATEPTVQLDGDILTLTGEFGRNVRQVYWLQKGLRLSTDAYPYVMVRWKSTGTCAISWVYYTDGDGESIVFYGSESQEWTTSIVRLPAGKTVSSVMVGLDDFTSDTAGQCAASFDFVMFARITKP